MVGAMWKLMSSSTDGRFGRRFGSSLVLALALSLGIGVGVVTSAHAHTGFYPLTWNNDISIQYYIDEEYPTGDARSRVFDAAAQWNALGGVNEPNFIYLGVTELGSISNACGAPGNGGIVWQELDGLFGSGVQGATDKCFNSADKIVDFKVAADSSAGGASSYYRGTGAGSVTQLDLWSLLTHELGHATGWLGHFAESSAECPNDSTRHTMCPGIYEGTERQRTPATHDIHSFEGAY